MSVSYLMKFDGIEGESGDQEYPQWVMMDSWSCGALQSGVSAHGTGAASGAVTLQDFTLVKHTDKASPKLMQMCATGEHIKEATLMCRRSGTEFADGRLHEYLKVRYRDLIISSFHTSGSAGDAGLPTESISFNYAEIFVDYRQQEGGKDVGIVPAHYNVRESESQTA